MKAHTIFRRRISALAAGLSLIMLLGTLPVQAASGNSKKAAPPAAAFTSQIGIWYTVWWDNEPPFNSHWTDWTRYRPVRGDYNSGDAATIRSHMQWMKQAGIDFVIIDDTNGHGNDNGNIAAHIDQIFDVVEAMPAGSAPKLAVAIGAGQWVGNDAVAHQAEADLIYTRYAQRSVYYQWKGKPLLVDYTTSPWFYRWDDPRFSVRYATGKVSEGKPVAPETGLWGWVFDEPFPTQEVMGVMPGWDTAHSGRGTTPIPREDGELYTSQWLDALKCNPDAVVIASFNDLAEETSIEAASPRNPETPAYTDAYGDPAPDWYEKLTEGYAGLKNGYREGFYYQEEQGDQLYRYTAGQLQNVTELPHGLPVITVPKGFLKGKSNQGEKDCACSQEKKSNKHVAVDLFASWVADFKGTTANWSYKTRLEDGQVFDEIRNGAVFDYIQPTEIQQMYSQEPAVDGPFRRDGFKTHPAWSGQNGWVEGNVSVSLPDKKKLYLTYIPGKVNTASDGITLNIMINGTLVYADWIKGAAGWKSKRVIDISSYKGQTVTIGFQVGWGKEQLGPEATPAYDSLFIGEPLIVTKR
ncbi:hypothetical protein [Paenibacillus sp. GCM10027626]|uniref:hypothetical protein n=1 Tax=Paenibacillus sp. GCM10027626 TaxID=3273411 RepID=UPI003642F682